MKKLIKNKILRRFFLVPFMGATFASTAIISTVYWQLHFGDTSALERTTILSKIKEETTLYYLDEKTRMGSIFESKHRRYILINEIPVELLNAVVASEDKNFYQHSGIDIWAIGKAFIEGVLNGGRFRRGGSTITQQTVKNIINDWETSLARKFREVIRALQLERLYTKKEILEFYLNRFHVVGNGNGVGIAAKYYFNKQVGELDLVEAAFIAGSLKGPSKYNPFIKNSKESKDRAIKYAYQRKNYVLRRMKEQGWISVYEYQESIKQPVPFNRGEFRNSEVSLIELVKNEMNRKEVLKAIGIKSIEELSFSGLNIYTTLDADLQREAQLAMRKNLSKIETVLQGFKSEPKEKYKKLRTVKVGSFVYAKIDEITGDRYSNYRIKLSIGNIKGYLSNRSLRRYAKLINIGSQQAGVAYHIDHMISQLKRGDVLYVQLVKLDQKKNIAKFELHKKPNLNGGLITIDKGEVRSLIAGFETAGFNRALLAKRQPGSVMKSFLFFTGLQLGWSILDRLDNERGVFHHQGRLYFPKPDHKSTYQYPSMLWTAIMSENIASVNMLYRLIEKINFSQFKELLTLLEAHPYPGEKERNFHRRIGGMFGISLGHTGIKEYQLIKTIDNIVPDLIFAQKNQLMSSLKKMWWGQNYLIEMEKVRRNEDGNFTEKEGQFRLHLLENNFTRYKKLYSQLKQDWDTLKYFFQNQKLDPLYSEDVIKPILAKFKRIDAGRASVISYYSRFVEEEEEIVFAEENMEDPFAYNITNIDEFQESLRKKKGQVIDFQENVGQDLFIEDLEKLLSSTDNGEQEQTFDDEYVQLDNIRLNGSLPVYLYKKLQFEVEKNYSDVVNKKNDKYFLYRYYQHQDFRVALGIHYMIKLAKECGVTSELLPVLSLALGSNDISVAEVAKMYQTFIEGKVYRFYGEWPKNQITFIRRIEDRFGNILFEPKRREYQLVKSDFALKMREILRKVMTNGTGRRHIDKFYVSSKDSNQKNRRSKSELKINIPAYGKTGTNNGFSTSYFSGFLPYPKLNTDGKYDRLLDITNSYVSAAYIGYDDNKPMIMGSYRVYGSSGALPLWADYSKKIIETKEYAKKLDFLDLVVLSKREWQVKKSKLTKPYVVDLARGVVLKEGSDADAEILKPTNQRKIGDKFQNLFAPTRKTKSVVYLPKTNLSFHVQEKREVSLFAK